MSKPTAADLIKIEAYRKTLDQYEKPSMTADIVAVRPAYSDHPDGGWRRNQVFAFEILLVKRGQWPHEGCWALPGGFIRPGESVEEGARRELHEETAIREQRPLIPVGVFSKPGRDMRAWIISNAFISVYKCGEGMNVKGGDDAAEAKWFRISNPLIGNGFFSVPFHADGKLQFTVTGRYVEESLRGGRVTEVDDNPLAFDHAEIIVSAFLRMLTLDSRELTFCFLPDEFSLTNYIDVYNYLTRYSVTDIPNFRRKITTGENKIVTEVGGKFEPAGKGHVRAQLYRRMTPDELREAALEMAAKKLIAAENRKRGRGLIA